MLAKPTSALAKSACRVDEIVAPVPDDIAGESTDGPAEELVDRDLILR
jgi:hypothetical protein